MSGINYEIKARCQDLVRVRKLLLAHHARFVGSDHQKDSYFYAESGRLKLREGNIENSLIHYVRENIPGTKRAEVSIFEVKPDSSLKKILLKSLKTLVVVNKIREIYFIGHVKFHLDKVDGLGNFIEVEAISRKNDIAPETLKSQCEYYKNLLGIKEEDLIHSSYADMI